VEEDPYFDPDDLGHNLFATAYDLEEGPGVPLPDSRQRAGRESELDQDSLGRAARLPVPTADDHQAAIDLGVERARRKLRGPADGLRPAEGVPGVHPDLRDAQRPAGEDQPGGGADRPGESAELAERDRVRAYLANPLDTKGQASLKKKPAQRSRGRAKARPEFEGCRFGFELGRVVHLPSGQVQITFYVPYEDRDEAVKLTATPGLLLEASVSAVEGRIP
jgi:hypothetical protein